MKEQLLAEIKTYLDQELATLLAAANQAHLAAIDEQSIAETQYDTLAIEAGYLAEGQSKRAQELKSALLKLETLSLTQSPCVGLGSLVQLGQEQQNHHWYFIAPAAAGFTCTIGDRKFTVITPQSPLGKALMGLVPDDEISVSFGTNKINDEIIHIE